MTDAELRKKVQDGLGLCLKGLSDLCPYKDSDAPGGCRDALMYDALVLLKKSFTPQEVYDTVVEHAQHDMRFKLGDKIYYSFTDVVDILNMELMCKAGDM